MTDPLVDGIPLPTQPLAYCFTCVYHDGGQRYEVTAERHHKVWSVGVYRMLKRRKGIAGWIWAGKETAEEACDEGWRRYSLDRAQRETPTSL